MGEKKNVLKIGSKNLDSENWKVFHPMGKHMFTCSGRKARWYLSKKLAKKIGEYEIKLTFEPNGMGYEEDEEFGRAVRKTRCVVSGVRTKLQRHHIVPYCYRSHFPDKYKTKNHHDVVLINCERHLDYEMKATEYKDQLAREYGIKTISEYNRAYSQALNEFNREIRISLSKLNAIFSGYNRISLDRIYDNLKYVSETTGIDFNFLKNCSYIQLFKLSKILYDEYSNDLNKFKSRHSKYYDHGWHLVKKLDSDEKIEKFIKLWRKHFIDTMNPQFMPHGWSVDFRCKTSFSEKKILF